MVNVTSLQQKRMNAEKSRMKLEVKSLGERCESLVKDGARKVTKAGEALVAEHAAQVAKLERENAELLSALRDAQSQVQVLSLGVSDSTRSPVAPDRDTGADVSTEAALHASEMERRIGDLETRLALAVLERDEARMEAADAEDVKAACQRRASSWEEMARKSKASVSEFKIASQVAAERVAELEVCACEGGVIKS